MLDLLRPAALVMLSASLLIANPSYAAGGGGKSTYGGAGGGVTTSSGGHHHHNAQLSNMLMAQQMMANQAIMNWNSALKNAAVNPMDDSRRQNLQNSYKQMNQAVDQAESSFKDGTVQGGLSIMQTELSVTTDPNAPNHKAPGGSSSKESGSDASASGSPGGSSLNGYDTTSTQTNLGSGSAGLMELTATGTSAKASQTAADEAKAAAANLSNQNLPLAANGFPIADTSRLSELQAALTPAEAAGGGVSGPTLRTAKVDSETSGENALDSDDKDAASAAPETAAGGSDIMSLAESLLSRWWGEDRSDRLAGIVGPVAQLFGKDWGLYGKGSARLGKHRLLMGDNAIADDLPLLLLKWLVLPSLLALLVWVGLNFGFFAPSVPAEMEGRPVLRLDPRSSRLWPASEPSALGRFYTWFDERSGLWSLVKTDRTGKITEELGHLENGSVVRASILHGRRSFRNFKLNAHGWEPTDESEHYLFNRGDSDSEGNRGVA